MKFLFDNCLPPNIARALSELDPNHRIEHLRDRFPQDIEDPEWIRQLADEGDWVIVSADTRIPKNPQNRQAWRQSGLTGFFFLKAWTNHPFWEQAWRAVRWWPDITRTADTVQPGVGFWVPVNYGGKGGKLKPIPNS